MDFIKYSIMVLYCSIVSVHFKINEFVCLICRYEVAPRSDSEDSGSDEEEVIIFCLHIPVYVCVRKHTDSVCACTFSCVFCR